MNLRPYEAVGPIGFGMRPVEVARELGAEPRSFDTEGHRVDQFYERGLKVHYAVDEGTVEFVETTDQAELEYDGLDLSAGRQLADTLAAIRDRGMEVAQLDPDLHVVPEIGVSLWAPAEVVESSGAFGAADYYD